ncbi:MAG: lamin tail domain-containing protein [Deltaproteobacteria bacterium]|nr:lamin tail domain-containing protein [Deltaproteobacteria bacterium]
MRHTSFCLVGALALTLLSVDGRAYSITVDGNPADWTWAALPTNNNTGHLVRDTSNRGEYVWKEVSGDDTDLAGGDTDSDITEFRITADSTNIYALVHMADITTLTGAGSPIVQIAIDRNRTASGSYYFCDDNTPANADYRVSSSARWEWLVSVNLAEGYRTIYSGTYGCSTTGRAQAATGTGVAVGSSGNNVVEIAIPWSSVGGTSTDPVRFTVLTAIAKQNGGIDTNGSFDVVTNYGHPSYSYNTSTELPIVDYYFDLWFGLETDRDPFPPLLISEVYPASGAAANQQWVEIFNTSNTNLTITGFRIGDAETVGAAETEAMYLFSAAATIPAGNAQVVAADATAYNALYSRNPQYELYGTNALIPNLSVDNSWSASPRTFDLTAAGDQLLLLDAQFTILDAVAWGTGAYPGVSAISSPLAGQSIERTRVYRDTNNCTTDFGIGIPSGGTPMGSCVDAAGGSLASGRACSNGNPCTTDTCNGAGTCSTGSTRTCSSDGNECTDDRCDGDYGGCYPPTAAGTQCTDSYPPTSSNTTYNCKDAQCNGAGACVQNYGNEPNGTACYDTSSGDCNRSACSSGTCNQTYGYQNNTYVCTDTDANDCWNARCSGSSATCVQSGAPASPKIAGTQCTDSNTADCYDAQCDGSTGCIQTRGYELSSYRCRVSAGACDVDDYCSGSSGTCADGKRLSSYVCRAEAAGGCDVAEYCDGSTNNCPGDVFRPSGYACAADTNPCTLDQCNGSSAACQHPAGNAGTICNASAGECDPAETCTGSSATCPTNALRPNGYACTADTNPCTLDQCNGTSALCQHPAGHAGTECRASAGVCDPAEQCTGSSTSCPGDAKSTAQCHASAGECDPAEVCNGVDNDCPSDAKRPSGYACTADTNPCTLDQCNGTSALCQHPAGNAGTVCNASTGECDPAETCTGSSTTCPTDALRPDGYACTLDGNPCTLDQCNGTSALCQHPAGHAGTECRASAGVCDPAEVCDGSNTICPADAKHGSSTTCRDSAGECDPAEVCNGVDNNCPSDAKRPSGYGCTDDGNPCTLDQCEGTLNACQHPAGNGGVVCRDAVPGGCDLAELCTGSSAICPTDSWAPFGTSCTDDNNACTLDVCDGMGAACPRVAGNAGAVCRPAASMCDQQEVCDGTSASCPDDVVRGSGELCRAASGPCDVDDYCDGIHGECVDSVQPSTLECRAAAGACDLAEFCDGSTGACPTDAKSVDVCRAAAGVCDVAEMCDGFNDDCPVDAKLDGATTCRELQGECDRIETCDGVGDDCPVDGKSTEVCRPAVGACDLAEYCDGMGNTCPSDQYAPVTTECDDDNPCTGGTHCDGLGHCVAETVICDAGGHDAAGSDGALADAAGADGGVTARDAAGNAPPIDSPEGCDCASGDGAPATAGWLLLLGALLLRRRTANL